MTEKLRPGVFSRYSAGPAGGSAGVRNAGLIAKGAAEKTGWAATPAELAALFPAEGDAALRQAGDWLLRHGAGRLWVASVADDSGYAAAFAASEGVDGLDTLLCDGAAAAVAAAFAESLAAAAENRRERVGVLAVGADSLALLDHVVSLLRAQGWRAANVDATILAQRPKLAPHIDQMRDNLAARLGLDREAVNVKATTEEGLGFTGSGDGMAAHAVCLLEESSEQ